MFQNINNFDELINKLLHQYNLNSFISPFKDCHIDCITDQDKFILTNLLKKGLWIFDYTQNKQNKIDIFTRPNISAFIKKDIFDSFAKMLSGHNIFIGIHDHLSDHSFVYKNGLVKEWNNEEDFITKFKLCFNDLGNPYITNLEHIWDYGSNMNELLKLFDDKQLADYFFNNFIEISIINKNFITTESLLSLCNQIIN